jgi:hypothetical protein
LKESASAQTLDFLARTKNSSFPNWKPTVSHPEFPDGHKLGFSFDFGILGKRAFSAYYSKSLKRKPPEQGGIYSKTFFDFSSHQSPVTSH